MSDSQKVPAEASFELVLSKTLRGEPVLPNAKCEFNYHWDFEKNMGIAMLRGINDAPVNITLHPLGIEGQLDFMSDIEPTPVNIDGKVVIIYRVILDINMDSGEREAAIMFGEDGETIETTENFQDASTVKSLPAVEA